MSGGLDVDKIVQEIRSSVDDGGAAEVDSATVSAVDRDSNLDELLAHANAIFAQPAQHSGFRGFLYRLAVKILAPEYERMRHYNEISMRIINKLSKMLSGNDTVESSDLAAQVRRRIDLLADLGLRLDQMEKQRLLEKVEHLESRIAELEADRKK